MAGHAADELPLAIASREYPHTKPIQDGSIQIPECRISYSTMTLMGMNRLIEQGAAGDVIEVDVAAYLKRFSGQEKEKHDWVLLPVFLWREFPQRHVRHIENAPSERLAVDISSDALWLWSKGILASSPTFKSLDTWDPSIMKSTWAVSFYLNPKTAEQEYFHETRIFPIITALAVRKELVDANPWLPEAIFIAFSEAKAKALEAGTIQLPWGPAFREETEKLMKKNYWSYGIRNNPKTLGALFKYAREQGVTTTELKAEDVFPLDTMQLIDEKGAKN